MYLHTSQTLKAQNGHIILPISMYVKKFTTTISALSIISQKYMNVLNNSIVVTEFRYSTLSLVVMHVLYLQNRDIEWTKESDFITDFCFGS